MKLLTFAIPCYNSEAYMEKCIESLLPGGDDVEILIVDDGSHDRTAEIADAYEKNAFQQKCYVNFLWLSRFLFLPEHNAMQEEASPGNFLITTDVRLFVGVFMMSNRQTGICFIEVFANTPYLQGVHHTHISGDHNDP